MTFRWVEQWRGFRGGNSIVRFLCLRGWCDWRTVLGVINACISQTKVQRPISMLTSRIGRVTESGGETLASNAGKFEENFTKKKIPKCSNRKRYVCKSWKEKNENYYHFGFLFFFSTSLHFILFKMFKNLFTYFHVYSFGRDRNSLNNLFLEFFINIINGWSIRSVVFFFAGHSHTHINRDILSSSFTALRNVSAPTRDRCYLNITIS